MYCIYRITNLINGKTYIGQHGYKDLNDNYMGSGTNIRRAIAKYGIESFTKDIIVANIKDREVIDKLEIKYIAYERLSNGNGCYNIADGGAGSNGNKGKPGKPHTEEFKEHQRQRMLGMPRTQEQKDAVSKANKGRKHTEEWKENNSKIMKEQYANGRKVVGFCASPSSGGKANADKIRQIKDKIRSEGLLCAEDIPKRQRVKHKVAYTIGQIKAYNPL